MPVAWMERHQVALFVAAIAVGAAVGLAIPDAGAAVEPAITPALGALLYVTFLGVPFGRLAAAFRDRRFLATVLVLNFVALPVVVFGLSRFVSDDRALLVGVLLVLLTPCVDYVVVFTGLAGGAREKLLTATPLLMIAQVALLPVYLWLMAGEDVVGAFDVRPFVEAFALLIVLPLALAVATQLLARRARWARAWTAAAAGAMVPLMMAVLAVVVGSQIAAVGGALARILAVVPIFVAFAVLAFAAGFVGSRGLDAPSRRAVVFSGVTRNSLVVLPLALALPSTFALAPLVVVTQTLVELVVMVAMVWVVPRVVRGSPGRGQRERG
ncbi:MAG: arsenic resistance protein [Microbacterium sp.]